MLELLSNLLRRADAGRVGTPTVEAKRVLTSLTRRLRAEQVALDQLRRRRSALEDRVRQALAANADNVAAEGARAIASIENDEAARRQALARVDATLIRARQSLATERPQVEDLSDLSLEPACRVRAEDVLLRLRTTPAPTSQYASP
jgi:phage shock protein A